jgi:hypothetical protein
MESKYLLRPGNRYLLTVLYSNSLDKDKVNTQFQAIGATNKRN